MEKPSFIPIRSLSIEIFNFEPNISKRYLSADLIISHAGAGTVLEVSRLQKHHIIVGNPLLMDNHQIELMEAMHSRGHCIGVASASALRKIFGDTDILSKDILQLKPRPKCRESALFDELLDLIG
ncbi:UDP-N-acetylglucosamine transferase subunit Alg13-like protein [Aduncisulcus paluster]|nr:UDP-N-acetylglucosamine transferase subunit Alg13-like protein [Aduncisulcus paluster]|eukprot:gnl/Carplike_NY0171/11126_a15834_146.p1 GENE.gnl/Carplike_NY0171/11126_a15834_146~~gnl/Carplike_NY0171/11126_a15834_146.p1  ORF type:complete len:125 (+),score=22.15 gnl/Carplike_NY0171/11126_a15834_146:158-532(+)